MAQAALAAGVRKAGLVSTMGAGTGSRIFYNRVKDERENTLTKMSFEGHVIARPSLLIGDRDAPGQSKRPGEVIGEAIAQVLGFLISANYKPIQASAVAQVLLATVPKATVCTILLSDTMRRSGIQP